MTRNTIQGRSYVVSSAVGGTVTTPEGVIICTFSAGEQTAFVAPGTEVSVSDDAALVTMAFNPAPLGMSASGGDSSTTTGIITSVGVFFDDADTSIYGKRFARYSDGTFVCGHYDGTTYVDDTGLDYCTYLAASEDATSYTVEKGAKNSFDSIYPWSAMQRQEIAGNAMVLVPKFALRIRTENFVFDKYVDGELSTQIEQAGYVVEISTHESPEMVATGTGDWRVCKAHVRPDGAVADYYGIGCYEASMATIGDTSLLSSVTGQAPKVSTTRAAFRALCADLPALDDYPEAIWGITSIAEMQEIMLPLTWVESACRSSQAAFGAGVSVMSAASNTGGADCINAYYPNAPLRSGNIGSCTTGTSPIVWRGIENPWGNVYKHVDGLIVVNSTDDDSVTTRQYYVQTDNDRAYFGEWNTLDLLQDNGYEPLNYETQTASGYVAQVGIADSWGLSLLPTGTSSGASSTLKYADYQYVSTSDGFFTPLHGGAWSNGAHCGSSFWILHNGLGCSSSNVGARLSLSF